MQFAEARTSASAQNPTIFNFNKQPIQIVVKQYEPWFIASDVAKVLGYRDASNAVRLLDQDEADTHIVRIRSENGVEQERKVLIVNESGLYALVLKSRKPEAKPFRRWVTSEVLPTIRKTGGYSCPIATITPSQQLRLREAVAKRAQAVASHYQTIYRALYTRFQIPRYSDLLAKDFEAAIEFIRTVDLRVPEVRKTEVAPSGGDGHCPHCGLRPMPKGAIILDQYGAEKLLGFVYDMKYLHRKQLESFHAMLVAVRSPLAGSFYETMNSWAVNNVESLLERNGYSVKDLDCYKHMIGVAR